MPKLKSHSGAKKRFSLTKTGKVKRAGGYADVTNESAIRKMIPYK